MLESLFTSEYNNIKFVNCIVCELRDALFCYYSRVIGVCFQLTAIVNVSIM